MTDPYADLQALADRWSREAAAIFVPDYIPGQIIPTDIAQAAERKNLLDAHADTLRNVLAAHRPLGDGITVREPEPESAGYRPPQYR